MSHRTQITLTDDQYDRLRRESALSGLGLAELIRRALERSYRDVGQDEVLEALDDSFGSWTGRHDEGEAYVETLRRGMARRLGGA